LKHRRWRPIVVLICGLTLFHVDVTGGTNGPDVIVGDLPSIRIWGTVGGITGYSVATDSCNIGNEPLLWLAGTNEHPLIGQNLYRLHNGRLEQIGMSWLKHGFAALAQNLCGDCQNPGTQTLLGVNCSDPYSATLNGDQDGFAGQGGLGPRSEVNAFTGAYPYPYSQQGLSGNAIYKRLQVHINDLDPAQVPGARFFVEGHYVTPDDASAGNQLNNASHREAIVGGLSGSGWNLFVVGETQRELPAIHAWRRADPAVLLQEVGAPGDGKLTLGSRCSDNGDGTWHYEYALYNMNSHRGASNFGVPFDAGVNITNLGFHDVDYHSGEPYDLTDWSGAVGSGVVSWQTQTFAVNENANALRWGTTYNFRFDADQAPGEVNVTVGLFRPGIPSTLTVPTCGPVPCLDDADGDGVCSGFDNCPLLPNPQQEDSDADNVGDLCDNCPLAANPLQEDTDSDGHGDSCDNCPLHYNPGQWDVDGDGPAGYCDNCPFDFNPSQDDFDLDGLGDLCDLDDDGDGVPDAADCDPLDVTLGAPASEVRELTLDRIGGMTTFQWLPPAEPGAPSLLYDLLQATDPGNFSAVDCVETDDSDTAAAQAEDPAIGVLWSTLPRAEHSCPSGLSKLGDLGDALMTTPVPRPQAPDCTLFTCPVLADCAAAPSIGSTPFVASCDTTGADSSIDAVPLACNGNYTSQAGPDHVYQFTVGPGNSLSFLLSTTDPDYDPSIYVVSTCGAGNSCVLGAAADSCFALNAAGNPCGATSDEGFGPFSFEPSVYYFYVDSFYLPNNPNGRDSGPYMLSVTGTIAAELVDFTVE